MRIKTVEALSEENDRLRAELESVRRGAAKVTSENRRENERLKAACAEMRCALGHVAWVGSGENDTEEFYCPVCKAHNKDYRKIQHGDCVIGAALSTSCGSDYEPRAELDAKEIELAKVRAEHDNQIQRGDLVPRSVLVEKLRWAADRILKCANPESAHELLLEVIARIEKEGR